MNDFFAQLLHNSVVAYADKVMLLASGDSPHTAAESLQLLLDTVCCNGEQTAIDRVLERAKRIITNQRTDSIELSLITLIALVSPHLLI